MDIKLPTTYIILGLHGEIITSTAFFMPRIPSMENCSFLVAVAVSAIMCTCAGNKLRISPILFSVVRKVSPLKIKQNQDNVVVVIIIMVIIRITRCSVEHRTRALTALG